MREARIVAVVGMVAYQCDAAGFPRLARRLCGAAFGALPCGCYSLHCCSCSYRFLLFDLAGDETLPLPSKGANGNVGAWSLLPQAISRNKKETLEQKVVIMAVVVLDAIEFKARLLARSHDSITAS